jgi:hypothetical protein
MRSRCLRIEAFAALVALAGAASAAPPASPSAQLSALVIDPVVAEISGMAASRRRDGLFWVHNDSDNAGALYALDRDGRVRATLAVDGVANRDWEDVASFERDGKPWLVIADVGDNGGLRKSLRLIVVREPPLGAGGERRVRPEWIVQFRWPDGPRDCEAVAVDPETGDALLVAKKRVPAQVFRVPLTRPAAGEPLRVAEQIASIPGMPQPTAEDMARDPKFARFRGQITAMDVDARGRRVVLLTYTDGYLFERRGAESWQEVFGRAPRALGLPPLPQGEAIAFDRRGEVLWVTSERLPAPLLHLELPAAPAAKSR